MYVGGCVIGCIGGCGGTSTEGEDICLIAGNDCGCCDNECCDGNGTLWYVGG